MVRLRLGAAVAMPTCLASDRDCEVRRLKEYSCKCECECVFQDLHVCITKLQKEAINGLTTAAARLLPVHLQLALGLAEDLRVQEHAKRTSTAQHNLMATQLRRHQLIIIN